MQPAEAKIGQSDIDQLLAQMSTESPANGPDPAPDGAFGLEDRISDQQKMERLLAELTGKPVDRTPAQDTEPASDLETAPAEEAFSGKLGQSDLDRLLAQMVEGQQRADSGGQSPAVPDAAIAPEAVVSAPETSESTPAPAIFDAAIAPEAVVSAPVTPDPFPDPAAQPQPVAVAEPAPPPPAAAAEAEMATPSAAATDVASPAPVEPAGPEEQKAGVAPSCENRVAATTDAIDKEGLPDQTPLVNPDPGIQRQSDSRPLPLKESRPGPRRAVKVIAAIGSVALLAAGIAVGNGWWQLKTPAGPAAQAPVAASAPEAPQPSFVAQATRTPAVRSPAIEPDSADGELATALQKAEALRKNLLEKHQALIALKAHYQKGIDAIKAQLVAESRTIGPVSPAEALKSPKIAFALQTIARRQAYLHQLEAPLRDLEDGSEKIRFAHRQAEIDRLVAPVAKGLDKAMLTGRLDQVMALQTRVLENLTVDGTQTNRSEPLEAIWTAIVGAKAAMTAPAPSRNAVQKTDPSPEQVIEREICSGNMENKYRITVLSEQTAGCLSRWEGKDLILNGLTVLSPAAAQALSRWPGSWLCLNGIAELTPEAAQHLFQWPGNRLSLNGLGVLSPQVSRHIAAWPGKQLELIGLGPVHPKVAEDLVAWQKAGGRLFIQEKR